MVSVRTTQSCEESAMSEQEDEQRATELEPTLADAAEAARGARADGIRARVARAPHHAFSAGEVLGGHLQVVRPLGSGGMGEVFVARDTRLGRRVALKTLRLPDGAGEAERVRFAQLFERDAASTAQLSHPNIVTIFQFGDEGGVPFFALELIDGQPLDVVLTEHGPMHEREALRLGVQLCEALAYAHAQGVVHRDIKPANLMRTRDGQLKVLDFGIALMRKARDELEEAFGASTERLSARLGEEPVAAGTPAYMAPEQLRGLEQDHRVDVWATGVTLYELLTGQRPYDSPFRVVEGFAVGWPDEPRVSRAVRRVIEGCLRFDVEVRTASMPALRAQLMAAYGEAPRPGAEARVPRRTNLEPVPDAFIGREEDLAQLDEAVFGSDAWLVTLVGPGGVGKTRLVTEWGMGVLERAGVDEVLYLSLIHTWRRRRYAVCRARWPPYPSNQPPARHTCTRI